MKNQQIKKKGFFQGFTLVELIIVITIISILATIAFVSFQSYAQQARDTKKVASLANIEKALAVHYTVVGKYPLPDNATVITLSGAEIMQQGIIGESLSNILKISNMSQTDVVNNILYSVSADRKRYQGLVFLEKPYISFSNNVYAVDYSQLYLKTFGDSIGMLLNTDNTPLSGNTFEITSVNDTYKLVFDEKESLSGTGNMLETLKNSTLGFHYKFESLGDFMFEGKKYYFLWNKKSLALTKEEKEKFTFNSVCGDKKLSDTSGFTNEQMKKFVNVSSQLMFDKFGKGEVGLNGLKNIHAYLAESETLSTDPGFSLVSKLHKYRYQVNTGNTCGWVGSYTPESYPAFLSGYSLTESYLGTIGFSYYSTAPSGSNQGNHPIFGPLYGINLYTKFYKNFSDIGASMGMIQDYVSSACASWNTSMGGGVFPYGYLEAYSANDTIFTKPSLEYGLRNDGYYNIAEGKTGYQQEYEKDTYTFGARLVVCND